MARRSSFAGAVRVGLRSITRSVRHSAPRGRRYAAVRHVTSRYRGPTRSSGVSRAVSRGVRAVSHGVARGSGVPHAQRIINRQVRAARLANLTAEQVRKTALLTAILHHRSPSRALLQSAAPSFVAGVHRAAAPELQSPVNPARLGAIGQRAERRASAIRAAHPHTVGFKDIMGTVSEVARRAAGQRPGAGSTSVGRQGSQVVGDAGKFIEGAPGRYILSGPGGPQQNQTVAALAHPGRLAKGFHDYATQRALVESSGGQFKSATVPQIDPKKLVIDTPRALAEHPSAIGKTLKDLALLPVSGPAGVVGAVADPAKAYQYFKADVNRRYSGSASRYRRRIGKEGAAAEVTDALAFGTPELKALGEGLGQVARTGAAGPRLRRFATEARPALRTSGNVAHAQDLSSNLFRASLQRVEDRRRAARTAKLNRKHPTAKPGLQPRGGVRPSGRPHEVVPLFQRRAQRVETSRVQSRNYQAFQHQHHQEVTGGAQHAISRLNRHQQRAVFHTLQGLVSLHDPARAVEQLLARRARVEEGWRASGVAKPPPELKTIDYLVRHADKVFTPELARFHAGELARAERVGHVGVSSTVAEARRYRPQARELGVDYTYHKLRDRIRADAKRQLARTQDRNQAADIKQRRDQQLAELDARRPELDRQFVATVKAKAAEQGLPEPVYVQHFKHQNAAQAEEGLPGPQAAGRAAHAMGGSRAAPGVKQSEMRLLDSGTADTSSQAYVQSVARTIKRGHNWRAMAQQVDTHAFPNPTPSELEAAFGHKHVNPARLTADEWKTVLTHRGVDHSEYALWSPGKFQREVSQAAAQDAQHGSAKAGAHDAIEMQAAFDSASAPAEQAVDKFGRDQGVRLIPREVYNELHATIKAASATGRLVDKLQGLQSSVLLGTNPSWLQIQVGANAFLAGFGTRGNVADFLKAPAFFRHLKKTDPVLVQVTNELFGTGVGEAHSRNAKLGAATNNRIVDGYRAVRAAVGFKAAAAKNAVPLLRDLPTLNPIHLMFSIDNAQNRYFKRVVLYNQVKRQAFRDMSAEGGVAFRLQAQIAHLLTLGPRARIEAIMRDPQLLERHAQAVDNVLGNYVRYTARERSTFKRYVLFYGFMRYSLRTLLYTLPVKHPIVASVVAKLAQLHNQEVRDLIGKNAPPWVYASIYMDTKVGKGGHMRFTDPAVQAGKKPPRTIGLARLNPVTNPLVDLATEGPKALGSFISPALQIALNQMYGRNLFTHRDYEPGTSGWRRVVNELGQLAFPYRALERQTQPGPARYYRSDTLLFDPRLKHYKTPAKRREERRAIAADRKAGGSLLGQLLPFVPRQDFTAQGSKARQKQLGKKKHRGGGGNLFGPGGGGGSGSFAPFARGGGHGTARLPAFGGTVFGRVVPADVLMRQGAARAALKVLVAASHMPDVKRHNLNVIRQVQRERPQYTRNANALFNRLKTTRDLPKWARNLPNPKIVFARYGLDTRQGSKRLGMLIPASYPGAAWVAMSTSRGSRQIVVSPIAVHGTFAGDHRNYYRQVPLHELAHTLQRQGMGHTLTEGGAEAFKRLAAHDLGLPVSSIAYPGLTRVAAKAGDKFVSRGQFSGKSFNRGVAALGAKVLPAPGIRDVRANALIDRVVGATTRASGRLSRAFPDVPAARARTANVKLPAADSRGTLRGTKGKLKLFAHPGRPGNKGQPGAAAQLKLNIGPGLAAVGKAVPIRNGAFVLPAAWPGAKPPPPPQQVGKPSVVLQRFSRYGVKDSSGKVLIPAKHAKKVIDNLSQRGYGHGQILKNLTTGTPIHKLGAPHQLVAAAKVLKTVKNAAPSGQKGVVYSAAKKFGIPPHVLWGVYGTETAFGTNTNTSSAGAQGPFQFLPSTADSYIKGGRANIHNFKLAAEGAARYLRALGGHKDIVQALNNYNGNRGGSNPNTSYVQSVMGNAQKFGKVQNLTPRQKRAVKVVQRAAKVWAASGSGKRSVPSTVPAQYRAVLGHIPTYGKPVKGALTMKDLPKPIQKLLRQYLQAASTPGVSTSTSTSTSTSGVPASTSSAAAAQSSAGGGGGGGAGGVAGLAGGSLQLPGLTQQQDQQAATLLSNLILKGYGPNSPLLTSGLLSSVFPGASLPATSTRSASGGAADGVPLLSVLLEDLKRRGPRSKVFA